MTGGQLQKLLDRAGLSQRGAARAIGISERHMRRYVAGEADVPLVVEFALRWVIHKMEERASPLNSEGL